MYKSYKDLTLLQWRPIPMRKLSGLMSLWMKFFVCTYSILLIIWGEKTSKGGWGKSAWVAYHSVITELFTEIVRKLLAQNLSDLLRSFSTGKSHCNRLMCGSLQWWVFPPYCGRVGGPWAQQLWTTLTFAATLSNEELWVVLMDSNPHFILTQI